MAETTWPSLASLATYRRCVDRCCGFSPSSCSAFAFSRPRTSPSRGSPYRHTPPVFSRIDHNIFRIQSRGEGTTLSDDVMIESRVRNIGACALVPPASSGRPGRTLVGSKATFRLHVELLPMPLDPRTLSAVAPILAPSNAELFSRKVGMVSFGRKASLMRAEYFIGDEARIKYVKRKSVREAAVRRVRPLLRHRLQCKAGRRRKGRSTGRLARSGPLANGERLQHQ